MKHKRQTLSKQSEDGDDKDSQSSGKGGKSVDKSLLDENSKKSCQNCDLPPGVLGDHVTSRNNNNNSTNFNNNSNASSGASSVTSTTSSFDKLEEDSRSNESSSLLGVKRHPSEIVVKIEGVCSSPSGGPKKPTISVKDNLVASRLMLSPESVVKTPSSSTPGTPSGPSPMDISLPAGPTMYQNAQTRPRSSPTAATAIATATASVTTVLQHPNQNMLTPSLVQIVRCSAPNSFPSPPQQSRPTSDYRLAQSYRQQTPYREMYSQRPPYTAPDTPPYSRQTRQNGMASTPRPTNQNPHSNSRYQNPNHPMHQQYCAMYNGYGHGQTEYQSYHRTSGYHNQNYPEDPYSAPGSTNYGSYHSNVYPVSQEIQNQQIQQHSHGDGSYYNDVQPSYGDFSAGKLQNSYYHAETMNHQGGDASSHYAVSSPDQFPNNPGSTAVMTPPNSVRTDSSSDHFNTFHHFYSETQTHPPNHHGSVSGENSNSSSDFNFLSNLANDFAPEYYQLS